MGGGSGYAVFRDSGTALLAGFLSAAAATWRAQRFAAGDGPGGRVRFVLTQLAAWALGLFFVATWMASNEWAASWFGWAWLLNAAIGAALCVVGAAMAAWALTRSSWTFRSVAIWVALLAAVGGGTMPSTVQVAQKVGVLSTPAEEGENPDIDAAGEGDSGRSPEGVEAQSDGGVSEATGGPTFGTDDGAPTSRNADLRSATVFAICSSGRLS